MAQSFWSIFKLKIQPNHASRQRITTSSRVVVGGVNYSINFATFSPGRDARRGSDVFLSCRGKPVEPSPRVDAPAPVFFLHYDVRESASEREIDEKLFLLCPLLFAGVENRNMKVWLFLRTAGNCVRETRFDFDFVK